MSEVVEEVIADLESVTEDARTAFAGLTGDQLNWKPAPESWSVAQCLEHLIHINRLYFPLLDKLASGPVTPTFWEKYSPLSGVLGRALISALSPDNPRKSKTSRKAEPSASTIDAGIVDRFADHQAELITKVRGISPAVERHRTIVTSPMMGWVTYSLDDCLTIIAVHEKRHLQQAIRAMNADGFPDARGRPAS
jgi:uncharacterized damage-inducible protein DinB